jgi:hypothetical protein
MKGILVAGVMVIATVATAAAMTSKVFSDAIAGNVVSPTR